MIKESTEEKVLGVIITKDLGWKTHCKKLQSELQSRIAVIRRLKLRLPTECVLMMIFTSKLSYALQIVASGKESSLAQLQVI
jgi:hypothetical protein